jgi:hypothetical protein
LADKIAPKLNERDIGPSKTPATMGQEELGALRSSKSIISVSLHPELLPILNTEELMRLHTEFDAAKLHTPEITESMLTALLTPSFTRLVEEVSHETESGLVISNTENIQWLKPVVNSSRNEWKKPDFVVAHPSMLIPR